MGGKGARDGAASSLRRPVALKQDVEERRVRVFFWAKLSSSLLLGRKNSKQPQQPQL